MTTRKRVSPEALDASLLPKQRKPIPHAFVLDAISTLSPGAAGRKCASHESWAVVEHVGDAHVRLWLNSGCPAEESLDKTTSSKSCAKQPKLKKSQC
jgi:hypothetical protein